MTIRSDSSLGVVSTFPPTVCGIASYTASLVGSLPVGDGELAETGGRGPLVGRRQPWKPMRPWSSTTGPATPLRCARLLRS